MDTYQAEYRKKHREKRNSYQKEYYKNHKEESKTYFTKYYEDNKEKIKEYHRKRKDITNQQVKDRLKTDINFKLAHYLRCRLRKAVKRNQKSGSAVQDLGCTISEFKLYLESKFQEGMSWDNYGYWGWHIDHVVPLDSFNLSNKKEFLKACHYTNLQPLWGKENISKSDKLLP